MQYRKDTASGNELSILGMGCMRFSPNKAETERMILAAIKGGVNFFDTAYIYPGSEKTLGDILARNKKRKRVYIATKLPLVRVKRAEDFDIYFEESLRRLQTDYIDYYMLHNITDFAQWERLKEMGIEEWMNERKKEGKIHNLGFSYHGNYDDFLKLLSAFPWGFTMVQYNYYDENYQVGRKGVETAARGGVSVLVMEPLLGGRLATGLPKKAAGIFAKASDTRTPADWALHWLWNHPEVTVAVSGMTSKAVLEKNLRAVETFQPLTAADDAVFADVATEFRKSYKVNCTGCNYCLPCPVGINIPACLAAYNARYVQGLIAGMTMYITSTAAVRKESNTPRKCNGCGLCEKQCPQYIPIRKELKRVLRKMEPLPIRAAMALVRKFM